MAETASTLAAGRPSYETADGRFDEDRLRDFVMDYDGPEDPDYPGCVPIPMTLEQFDNYAGGVEYWSRERGTALVCRDGGPAHEIPGGMLPGLLTRVEIERGSLLRAGGGLALYLSPNGWVQMFDHAPHKPLPLCFGCAAISQLTELSQPRQQVVVDR